MQIASTPPQEDKVGFELIEIISIDSIYVWVNNETMTQEQFDSIQITNQWVKNEPRESDPDSGAFLRSPDALSDGDFTVETHFGYEWLFNAQIIDMNVSLPDNDDGLLVARSIAKFHQVHFLAGRTIYVLVSPNGEEYIRISRDANRTTDIPIIPNTWELETRVLSEDISINLPNPTINIRAENNQDSFQGPVSL